MNIKEKNIEIILQNANHVISSYEPEKVKEVLNYYGQDDQFEYFISEAGREYGLQDLFDAQFETNVKKRELFIITGIYAVDEIRTLISKAHEQAFFVIVEPNLSLFLHALERKDLSFLVQPNVMLIVKSLEELHAVLEDLFTSSVIVLTSNLRFYVTYFYRIYDKDSYRKLFKQITTALKYKFFTIGNDIKDSLKGLNHHLINIRKYNMSKSLSHLKNKFSGYPAIIVAAGPSLEKNIHQLKQAKNKALIIAVDTIGPRLLLEGIIPDFICSIERYDELYDFFYKNKNYPEEVTLVAPPVVTPQILDTFNGNLILPMRERVREYFWLRDVLSMSEDDFIRMGSSCAHVAFGFAVHTGASPIILVGQDLAYADDGITAHSSGTVYDLENVDAEPLPKVEVDGYFGGKILSHDIWIAFRNWFEIEIMNHNLVVINATEGGSRIEGTKQMPMAEVIVNFCRKTLNVYHEINKTDFYCLDYESVKENLKHTLEIVADVHQAASNCTQTLQQMNITEDLDDFALMGCIQQLKKTDSLFRSIREHELLFHLFQADILQSLRKLYAIEEVLCYDSVQQNLQIQLSFTALVALVTESVKEILQEAIARLDK